jgi:hypothetical protein
MNRVVDKASVVELADRQTQDSNVSLFWARRSGRLWVRVDDHQTGRTTRIDANAANALDVFHHPRFYELRAA